MHLDYIQFDQAAFEVCKIVFMIDLYPAPCDIVQLFFKILGLNVVIDLKRMTLSSADYEIELICILARSSGDLLLAVALQTGQFLFHDILFLL